MGNINCCNPQHQSLQADETSSQIAPVKRKSFRGQYKDYPEVMQGKLALNREKVQNQGKGDELSDDSEDETQNTEEHKKQQVQEKKKKQADGQHQGQNDQEFFGKTPSTLMDSGNLKKESSRYGNQTSLPTDTPQVVKRIVRENIRDVYKLGKLIGSGNFGTVRLAEPKSNPHKVVAIKSIPREKVEDEIQMLEQELMILMEVDHPNIVKFYQVYRDKKYFHIVMELCNGEELFEHLTLIGKFSEADAAKIIKQILSAIKHLHDKNIAHRDLKPENIIFMHTHDKNEINIKLIDFGLSKILSKDKRIMMTKLGTPYYVSPEVLEGIYDKRCDIWAVGVIAYILLSGTPPFNGRNEIEVFNKIRCCDYEFPEKLWSYISEDAKDFISKLLHPDPDKRMSAEQGLQHKWLQSASEKVEICLEVMERLKSFRSPKRLQQQLLLLLVNQMDENELKKSKITFKAIDVDHSGLISPGELKKALQNSNKNDPISDELIEQIVKKLDYDNNGEINYSEFLSGTIDDSNLNDYNLSELFNYLDVYKNNYLTKDSFIRTFERSGRSISEQEVIQMMEEMQIDPNSQINYSQFCNIIKNIQQ